MRSGRGFTLIELIVVLAILGIVAAVAVPELVSRLDSSPGEREVARVTEALERSRAHAVRSGETARARIVEMGAAIEGPAGRTELGGSARVEAEAGESEIAFYPTGLSSGGRWVLLWPGAAPAYVEVSVLDGAIHVVDGTEAGA